MFFLFSNVLMHLFGWLSLFRMFDSYWMGVKLFLVFCVFSKWNVVFCYKVDTLFFNFNRFDIVSIREKVNPLYFKWCITCSEQTKRKKKCQSFCYKALSMYPNVISEWLICEAHFVLDDPIFIFSSHAVFFFAAAAVICLPSLSFSPFREWIPSWFLFPTIHINTDYLHACIKYTFAHNHCPQQQSLHGYTHFYEFMVYIWNPCRLFASCPDFFSLFA